MKHCPHCGVNIKGEWETCPLCHRAVERTDLEQEENPYPNIPLLFNTKKVIRLLMLASLLIILGFFIVEFFIPSPMNTLQMALFGIMSLWLVVLIIIRKRRNIAKGIVYLIVSLSLICVYWDFQAGWSYWSTTYAIPIICSFAIIGMFIAVRIVHLKVGDYILYLLTATILGLVPGAFLFFSWITLEFPSQLSLLFSILMLLWVLANHGKEIRAEWHKRAQI